MADFKLRVKEELPSGWGVQDYGGFLLIGAVTCGGAVHVNAPARLYAVDMGYDGPEPERLLLEDYPDVALMIQREWEASL